MEKTIVEQLTELKAGLEKYTAAEVKAAVENIEAQVKAIETKADKTELKAINDGLAEIKSAYDEFKAWRVTKDETDKKNQDALDNILLRQKDKTIGQPEKKSFNDYLAETIERNADKIKGRRPFTGSTDKIESFDMFTEDEKKSMTEVVEGKVETKAVGDMSLAANFPGANGLYTDVRNNLIETPVNRVYLADILPNSTSTGTRVGYPKENGTGEGGVASWTDYSADKAQVDFDLVPAYSDFVWGAGWVVVQRDMLDDIPFMTSYLQNRLLLSLKNWENGFIINGAGTVDGFEDVASPYNGSYTNAVDRALDAALGQIPDATSDFYFGTHIITRRRDLVQKFMLNKASGSGEYDLPENAVTYNADGTVRIGNLTVVGTTAMAFNTFFALDNRATAFIRRIQPELRLFEDATLAKKNQVMWRIEERATLVIFNNAAIVKGVLQVS